MVQFAQSYPCLHWGFGTGGSDGVFMKGTNDGAPRMSVQSQSISLPSALQEASRIVDATLDRVLPKPHGLYARVQEAMRYATFAGGKRLRPFLVLHSARLFGVDDRHSLRVGAAIEVLHTYSLVHDDLPCMDDDDLRRGRPTTHKKFGVAVATEAGLRMVPLAGRVLAAGAAQLGLPPRGVGELPAELCRAAGGAGMIGGQVLDLEAEGRPLELEGLAEIHRRKTGALIAAS